MASSLKAAVGLGAAVLCLAASGCVPSDPGNIGDPVSAKWSDNHIEIAYVDCQPQAVTSVTVIRPLDQEHQILSDQDDVVWMVTFAEAAQVRTFEVGDVPPGAAAEKPLVNGLNEADYYVGRISLDNGRNVYVGFRPNELRNHVSFHGRYMTEEEYSQEVQCSDPSTD